VNENLKLGPNGLSLLMDFEKGDDSVPLSENGAALAPYVCPGDELTIGWGCTHWFDGEPVQIHHRLEGEADALNLLMLNLTSYEDAVRGALTREATQNQFDGMVCLCFNIGKSAFVNNASVLKSFNLGRMEDAAANFGLWTGSTTARPKKKQINDAAYADKLKQDHKGLWRWVGPEGQYCSYMLRLDGLLYRHYAEALLFMSRDYRRTLRSSTAIELKLEPTDPSAAEWDAGKGRWIDKVKYRTPFKDVYAAAYDDRLPEATQPAPSAEIAQATHPESSNPLSPAAPKTASEAKAGSGSVSPNPAEPVPVSVSEPQPKPTPVKDGVSASPSQNPPILSVPGQGQSGGAIALPKVAPAPAPKPPASPPVIAGQDGAKPIHRETKMPEGIPYGIDPTVGAKPMETTERFIGSAMLWLANGLRVGMANGMKVSGAGGFLVVLFLDMMKSPVTSALILSTIIAAICAVGWLCGVVLEKAGLRKKKKGEASASQLMY